MLKNAIYQSIQKTAIQRYWEEVELETKCLRDPYLGEDFENALYFWRPERAIILSAPTGCGKTTFVLRKIVKPATKKRSNVLILVNRKILGLHYKKEVVKILKIADLFTDKGLEATIKFENVFVVNYQNYRNFLREHGHMQFDFVIADEAHFFLTDATFNSETSYVLEDIPKRFAGAKRLYMSATIKEILPYILQVEASCFANLNNLKQQIFGEQYSLSKYTLPQVFEMPSDYSKINLKFFDDEKSLLAKLAEGNEKCIIFVKNIAHEEKILKNHPKWKVISAPILNENTEIAKELLENESFQEQAMVSTAVFSNGNNIQDEEVKNVVSFFSDEVNLVQMLGRKRLNRQNPNEFISLFICIPKKETLIKQIETQREVMEEIAKCAENPKYLSYIILNPYLPVHKKIKNVAKLKEKGVAFEINPLSKDSFMLELRRAEKHLLQIETNEDLFCEEIAAFFGKEYDPHEMRLDFSGDKEAKFIKFLKSLSQEFPESEFDSISERITAERLRIFGKAQSDNTGKNRKPLKTEALNSRFQGLNIPVQLKAENDCYRFVWEGVDAT